ncbi:MAG: hypothetical protein IPP74_05435 [Alphaproteobacteria bacterium]|nr:hypothetical protein [Alphaproteobacteria bacterium]
MTKLCLFFVVGLFFLVGCVAEKNYHYSSDYDQENNGLSGGNAVIVMQAPQGKMLWIRKGSSGDQAFRTPCRSPELAPICVLQVPEGEYYLEHVTYYQTDQQQAYIRGGDQEENLRTLNHLKSDHGLYTMEHGLDHAGQPRIATIRVKKGEVIYVGLVYPLYSGYALSIKVDDRLGEASAYIKRHYPELVGKVQKRLAVTY